MVCTCVYWEVMMLKLCGFCHIFNILVLFICFTSVLDHGDCTYVCA